MLYCHERLAAIWAIQKKADGVISDILQKELTEALEENLDYCYKMAKLKNMSLAAFMVNDFPLMHEICAKIDALENAYSIAGEGRRFRV